MTRLLLTLCCALLPVAAWAQRAKPPSGGDPCIRPAECTINAPVFNFGRSSMNGSTPPVYSNASISVTCTRAAVNGLRVDVLFDLWGEIVNEPPRVMRDIGDTGVTLAYDMYIDPARTRLWGSGHMGSFPLQGTCFLDDRNRVCTIPFLLYGTVLGGQQAIPPGKYQGAVVSRLDYQFGSCQP